MSAVDRQNQTRNMRTGSVTLLATDTSKRVTLVWPMPSDQYIVLFEKTKTGWGDIWSTARTATDFIVNVAGGVAGTINYVAIEL